MIEIKNKKELISNEYSSLEQKSRRLAIMGLEAAFEVTDPIKMVESKVKLKKHIMTIDGKSFDLHKFENIYVVGAGKASGYMAEAIEKILGNRITRGSVNILQGTKSLFDLQRINVIEASHPLPNEDGISGTKRILDLVKQTKEKDMIICLISGGGSSLMSLPCKEVSLKDIRMLTDYLLKSGININGINTIRKHISRIKGGCLAREAYPATVISLILSDVVGDPLDVIASGPTVPDPTTFGEAIELLEKNDLWKQIPESIKTVLLDGKTCKILETPKSGDIAFKKVHNFIIGNNRTACLAICDKLRAVGLNVLFLTSYLEGESKEVGAFLAAIAREIHKTGNPISKPAAVILGGETTVKVTGSGIGGRNQEIALGAALKIAGLDNTVIASINTDGFDGPTDTAGALVDGKTIYRSSEIGLEAEKFLSNNDSFAILSKLNSLIYTGFTGTNVNDISLLIVT